MKDGLLNLAKLYLIPAELQDRSQNPILVIPAMYVMLISLKEAHFRKRKGHREITSRVKIMSRTKECATTIYIRAFVFFSFMTVTWQNMTPHAVICQIRRKSNNIYIGRTNGLITMLTGILNRYIITRAAYILEAP